MIKTTTDYDVIIIGGGHNGMLCGAYLAKSGGKILVLERKSKTGGGLVTDDFQSPFRFNLHATYMMMADVAPSHTDLDLQEYGLQYVTPDTQIAFHHKDGKALVFFRDPEKTAESVAMFSESDAERFRTMFSEFKTICDEVLIPEIYLPPMPPEKRMALLQETELGRRVAEISKLSPAEIIDLYGFEHPRVKGALLYLATLWGIKPDAKGVGHLVPLWIYRMMNAALVRGGSQSLAFAVQTAFRKAGGQVIEHSEVEEIVIADGVAVGVKTADGREYTARAVVSTVNPKQTFLEFIDEKERPQELTTAASDWKWEDASLFTCHYGIVGAAPDYTSAKFNPAANSALINVIGIESSEDVLQAHRDVSEGRFNPARGHATCTSQFDRLAAVGQGVSGEVHTLRFESWAPYKLDEQDWDAVRKEYMKQCRLAWEAYAPNLQEASFGFEFVVTPRDIERRLINMSEGSIKQGRYDSTQQGFKQLDEKCSHYATPIGGLYLGGAAVHPGGLILHGAGYNAAKVIAQDLGLSVWWREPDMIAVARAKKYVQEI